MRKKEIEEPKSTPPQVPTTIPEDMVFKPEHYAPVEPVEVEKDEE